MSGWFPVPDDGWDAAIVEVGAYLRVCGPECELPRALAIADLRWWCRRVLAPNSTVTMPNHRRLAERWRWGEKRARLLVANEAAWLDERAAEDWHRKREGHSEGTTGAQRGHSEGTTDHGSPDAISTRGHSEGTARAQSGHTKGDTRGEVTVDSDTSQLTSENRLSSEPVKKKSLWPRGQDEEAIEQAYGRLSAGKKPTQPEIKGIRRVLSEGHALADVLAVLEWSFTSDHFTATQNRKGGYHRSETPWRPSHFETYLGFARLPAAPPARHIGGYDASGPALPVEAYDGSFDTPRPGARP